jgi:hypothetical protein
LFIAYSKLNKLPLRENRQATPCGAKTGCHFPQWKNTAKEEDTEPKNPLVGGIWLDYDNTDGIVNYKFTETGDGTKVYSIASATTFNVAGTYEYRTVSGKKELTLRHNGQTNPVIYTIKFTTADQVLKLTETVCPQFLYRPKKRGYPDAGARIPRKQIFVKITLPALTAKLDP